MGVNNRQRRAAKRHKRESQRGRGPGGMQGGAREPSAVNDDVALVRAVVGRALGEIDTDPGAAARHAQVLTGPDSPIPMRLVRAALQDLLRGLVVARVGHGWRPSDLSEITRRRLGAGHLPPLAGLLVAETDRHATDRVAPAWRDDLAGIGPAEVLRLDDAAGLEVALGLCAVLRTLPVIATLIAAPGTARAASPTSTASDPKLLARVRSLLAKAESTEYVEEAEALSAKAQELISRHALDRLLVDAGHEAVVEPVTALRVWIDPPYVLAKAMLVGAAAEANRCRSVVTEALGFCTVVGERRDLDAVDLLVTSLLVQASTAMLRCGRQADRRGTSRTRSFRQSFLMAYATRIGERLSAATADAAESTGRSAELVPVLRQRVEDVDAACAQLFPRLLSRKASIGNAQGWVSGRAAADLARLDTNLAVTEAAG